MHPIYYYVYRLLGFNRFFINPKYSNMKKASSGKTSQKATAAPDTLGIDLQELKKAELIVKSLNHKLRLAILKLLSDNPKMPVTAIYGKLKMEQSVASQHLGILRNAGIVTGERQGQSIYYSANIARVTEITKLASKLIG